MGDRVDVRGHPTWVDQRGAGDDTILLLHGGLSNSDALFDTVGTSLESRFRLVGFDRRGHGHTADTEAPFHYDDMASETIAVLEQVIGSAAHLVGWSDGGIVALAVAMRRPDLVRRMVLIGTNFHYDAVLPADIDADSPAFTTIRDGYSATSPDGPEHFDIVAAKAFALFTSEPTWTIDDIATIETPALVMVGDDDMIGLGHTCALFEALPNGQLAIVPSASHALPMERPALTAGLVADFLSMTLPPRTLMPIRRS